MKKFITTVAGLLLLLVANPLAAQTPGKYPLPGPAHVPGTSTTSGHYRTYTVVEVTETVIVLQALTGERVEIEKSRRPELKVGDRVRYKKTRNRLGETLPPEPAKSPAAKY